MGCSASKGSARKRTVRESWYAPLTRCASAPIHYVPEVEQDHYHFEGSPSTLYSFIERDALHGQRSRGTLAYMLQEDKLAFVSSTNKHVYHATERDVTLYACESHDRHVYHATERDVTLYACEAHDRHVYHATERNVPLYAWESHKRFAPSKPCANYSSKLNAVEEVSESDACDVETINTWELMQGLDEDDGSRTSSPVKTPPRRGVLEKSISFNKVHGLDSCFAEMGSPVWRRYFAEQDGERHEELDSERLGCSEDGAYQNGSILLNPAKSLLRSPMRSPAASPWRTPARSPLKSPIRSPFRTPSSPLFDPSLLAKFEQAIQAVALPQDEWLLTHSNNEGSMTTSSSSFNNHTWVSSETSSDGDSAQCVQRQSPLTTSQTVSPWINDVDVSYDLESFELRCPPKGEGKVVLYFTSLRGVRKTYEDCCILRRILQGLGVYVDERDVWMHSKFREELTELLDNKQLQVPRLFIKGRYIGGMEDVCQLHEDGHLMRLIEGVPSFGLFRKACEGCADVRFVPCFTCRGSCKVLDEADHVVRCSECNENGLIMCPLCS